MLRQIEYKTVSTYTASIWIGCRIGYDGECFTTADAIAVAREYCDEVGLGVSVSPTNFVYTDGQEPGGLYWDHQLPAIPRFAGSRSDACDGVGGNLPRKISAASSNDCVSR